MFDVRAEATRIAEVIRANGCSVELSHSTNDVGLSSYVYATAGAGKFWAKFGVRVSDHAVSSSRYHREALDIQHHIMAVATDAQIARIADMARRALAHVEKKNRG